jgi:intracellular sulfur oxidation DsrE/DsrF family protein
MYRGYLLRWRLFSRRRDSGTRRTIVLAYFDYLVRDTKERYPVTLIRRSLLLFAAMLPLVLGATFADAASDEVKRLAVQVSDRDPATFMKALNVVTNFAKNMSAAGQLYEVEIVAFHAGLHLLRTDTSPVIARIERISESIPDVTFSACRTTFAGMTKKEGKAPPLTKVARFVPAGTIRLMELDALGYFVIRP